MRLLFAYDHRFRSDGKGTVWTTGALSTSVWARYLNVFDELHVIGRNDGPGDESRGFALSSMEGVSFTFLPNVNSLRGTLRRNAVGRQILSLVAESDAIIARLPSEFGLIACEAARRLKKPYLIEVVGSAYDAYSNYGSWVGKGYAPIAERRVRRAVAKASFVIYVTEHWLQSQYPSKHPELASEQAERISGVQAGATDALLSLPVSRQVAASVTNASVVLPVDDVQGNRRERLQTLAAGREPVLGTVGSLATRYKGIQVALPALAELRREGFRFTYRVLGGGDPEPWQKMIDELGLSDCCFLDGVRRPGLEVLQWLDQIDIYLQPSLQEGLPRAVLEAMSRGLACIGSSAGGISELVLPGYIHKAGDSRQLGEHLRKLMRDPEEVARLSTASFERVLNYAPDIVEGKRVAMLRTLRRRAEHPLGAVFVHDHVFRRGRSGEVWTSGAHSSALWNRYLGDFQHLTVIGRDGGVVRELPAFARADAERVGFELMPDINGIPHTVRRALVRRRMTNVVRSADAVIARLPSELGFIACSVARKLKKPLLVEVVGSAGEALRTHGSHIARAYAPVAERRMRRAVASSQFVTYVTKQWLQRCYPSPNPPLGEDDSRAQARVADVVIESPGSDVVEARKRRLDRLEQGGVPVFGTIASLAVGYKGLQLAIPAFGELKREGFTFIYRILGPGNPEPWQRLIDRHGLSDCCFLDGARPSGQPVLDWLDDIDVHVQPSLTESLGRAQIEAMSRGVACVSSNAGGLGEYGSPEWQHPPGDRAALTTLLRRVLEDPCLVAGMSAAAFQAAKQFEPAALEPERSRMMALLARAARHG